MNTEAKVIKAILGKKYTIFYTQKFKIQPETANWETAFGIAVIDSSKSTETKPVITDYIGIFTDGRTILHENNRSIIFQDSTPISYIIADAIISEASKNSRNLPNIPEEYHKALGLPIRNKGLKPKSP